MKKFEIIKNLLMRILGVLHISNENMFPRPLKESETAEYFQTLNKWKKVEAGLLPLSDTEIARLREEKTLAREKLILHNMRLVSRVSQKYSSVVPSEQEELIPVGTFGLIKAVDSFDINKNVKFSSYAAKCISNEIGMHLRKINPLINIVKIGEAFNGDDNDDNDCVIVPSNTNVESDVICNEMLREIVAYVKSLPPVERKIFDMRFGIFGTPILTQKEVAENLDICRSYVSRIETKIRKRLIKFLDLEGYNKSKDKNKPKVETDSDSESE